MLRWWYVLLPALLPDTIANAVANAVANGDTIANVRADQFSNATNTPAKS